jgi:predicted RNase H-like HicB family nuclease
MNPGYRIEVTWSAEDQVWIANVPDLLYCSAHSGSS